MVGEGGRGFVWHASAAAVVEQGQQRHRNAQRAEGVDLKLLLDVVEPHAVETFGQLDVIYNNAGITVSSRPGGGGLRAHSDQAYTGIFRLLDAQGLPHLWRVWNYMADINGSADGLERYRQFNLGRAEAFLQGARSVVGRVPAACALGLAGGPLSIAFLAGSTPAVPIENPRQVSAYHYPAEYGPRSPTFSRAALVYPPGQELLFISGTASIVGHQSVHPGDVVAQTRESMDNVAVVLDQANQRSRSGGHALGALSYRVYIRHAADTPQVQAVMAERVGAAPVVCVLADVCRAELLVEVEAQGLRPL